MSPADLEDLRDELSERFSDDVVNALADLARAGGGPTLTDLYNCREHGSELLQAKLLLEELLKLVDWKSDTQGNHWLSCWAGYHRVKEPLKRFHHTVAAACQTLPKRRQGPQPDFVRREIAKRIGRVLAENGIRLAVSDARRKRGTIKQSHFAFAVSKVFAYDGRGNITDTKKYLVRAIAALHFEEEVMSQVPKARRKEFKSVRRYLPPQDKGHSKFKPITKTHGVRSGSVRRA